MDVLDDVFNMMGLRSKLLSRTEISPPWRCRFRESDDVQFHIIDFGRGYLYVDGDPIPKEVSSGDIIVLPFGDGHEICDSVDSSLAKTIEIGHCRYGEYQIFPFASAKPDTVLLCGIFYFMNRIKHPFLEALPRIIHIRSEDGSLVEGFAPTLAMIAYESKQKRLGAATVRQHLTDMLFIQTIRAWIASEKQESFLWLDALGDLQIGKALQLIHQEPEKSWSVEELATQVASSRSAFSARFAQLVGETPIRYLLRWRMVKASQLFRAGHSISEVAYLVGYESEVAFRKAFKREVGMPPGKYRQLYNKSAAVRGNLSYP